MKCKSCKSEFEPVKRNGIIVSKYCFSCLITKGKEKRVKEARKEKKDAQEALKTHSEWLNDLQRVFNTYIRERDKGKPCISCGNPLTGKFDAGHYFSVGAYPNLRFNELNVHGQCVACNQHKHGNINEYSINLPLRIGNTAFDDLLNDRNKQKKLSTVEIKELIKRYKELKKELQ